MLVAQLHNCRYCGMPISSDAEWEQEALIVGGSCFDCVLKIEQGELVLERRIQAPTDVKEIG